MGIGQSDTRSLGGLFCARGDEGGRKNKDWHPLPSEKQNYDRWVVVLRRCLTETFDTRMVRTEASSFMLGSIIFFDHDNYDYASLFQRWNFADVVLVLSRLHEGERVADKRLAKSSVATVRVIVAKVFYNTRLVWFPHVTFLTRLLLWGNTGYSVAFIMFLSTLCHKVVFLRKTWESKRAKKYEKGWKRVYAARVFLSQPEGRKVIRNVEDCMFLFSRRDTSVVSTNATWLLCRPHTIKIALLQPITMSTTNTATTTTNIDRRGATPAGGKNKQKKNML